MITVAVPVPAPTLLAFTDTSTIKTYSCRVSDQAFSFHLNFQFRKHCREVEAVMA
jgi:hypothetical protein